MKGYLKPSRTLSVSLVAVLPLLAAYEVGILVAKSSVQTHAGLLVKRMIWQLGLNGYAGLTALVSFAFIIALASKRRGPEREFKAYPVIILEGALYGMLLGPFIERLQAIAEALAAVPPGGGQGVRFLLYMGAGVWEELVFRLALLGGLYFATVKVVRGNRLIFGLVALLLSSLAFAGFHHVGANAEPFTSLAFAFRLLAGGVLGTLYLSRGLGVCVYTHAFHNLFVLFLGSR